MSTKTNSQQKKDRERFLVRFNQLVGRIVNLEVVPDIQSKINERIPKQTGFTVYDGSELWDYIQTRDKKRMEEIFVKLREKECYPGVVKVSDISDILEKYNE